MPEAPAHGSSIAPAALVECAGCGIQDADGQNRMNQPSRDRQLAGSTAPSLDRRRHPALDGLRCVAISGVVWHHSLPCAYPGWLGRGHAGVSLFFALSGFLITKLLLAERKATGDIALGQFWMRRSLRIFPLYYATLVGFVLVLGLRAPSDATRHFWSSLPFYASYTSNWFVDYGVSHPVWFGFAWSLATEEQFYLWWPTFLRHAERLTRALAPLGLLALLALDQLAESGVLARWLPAGSAAARISTSVSGAMALGAMLGWAVSQRRAFAPLERLLGARHSTELAAAACAGLIWQPIGPPLLLELAFAVLVGSAASSRGPLARGLALRPLVHVGRVSYGMYLFHVPVLGLLKRSCPWLVERPLALFPAAFLSSLAVAAVSFRTLEAPL
jgi:peptidoglycan/LPS O-acetylase OafA/YrhL